MFYADMDAPEVPPEQVIYEEIQRSYRVVRWLEGIIGQWTFRPVSDDPDVQFDSDSGELLPARSVTDLVSSAGTKLPTLGTVVYFDKGGTVAPTEVAAWLSRYLEERKHAVAVSKMAIDAGVDLRLVRLAERDMDLQEAAWRMSLAELGIEVTPEVAAVIVRNLRAIDGQTA